MTYKIISGSFSFKRLHNELDITLEEELSRFLAAGDVESLLQISLPIDRVVLQSLGSKGVKLDTVIEAYGRELGQISPAKKDKLNAVLKELMPHIPFDISKTTNVEVVDAFSQKLTSILEVFRNKEEAMGPDDLDTVEVDFQRNQGAWVNNIILDAVFNNLDSDDIDICLLLCSDRAFVDALLDRDDEFFSYMLDFLSEELKQDVELATKALPKGYTHFFSESVTQAIYNEKTARERLDESGLNLLEQFSGELRAKLSDDAAVVTRAVRKNGFDIFYASERLKDDFEIARLALVAVSDKTSLQRHSPYRYFSDRLKQDRKLLYEAARYGVQFVKDIPAETIDQISRDDTFLKLLFSQKLDDYQIRSFEQNRVLELTTPNCAGYGYCTGVQDDIMRVLSHNPAAIELLPEVIRNSTFFLISVASLARQVPESFYDAIPWNTLDNDRFTKRILVQLLKAHSDVYLRFSEEIKQDRDILVALAESHPDHVFRLIPETVVDNRTGVINMLERSARLFLYLPKELSHDKTYMKLASYRCEKDRGLAFDFIEHQAKIVTCLAEEFRGHKETVLEALSRNTRVIHYISNELKQDADIIRAAREDGLLVCSEFGGVDVARELISSGVSPNAADDNGLPCLHVAVQNRQLDIARFLLENGADVNGVDSDKLSVIYKAHCNDDFEMVELLKCFNPVMAVRIAGIDLDMNKYLPGLSLKRSESEAAVQLAQETDYRTLMGDNFLGQKEWKQAFGLEFNTVVPIPESFSQEFLLQPCPLTGAPHIKDTHILFFMPLGLSLDKMIPMLTGSTVPNAKVDMNFDIRSIDTMPFGLKPRWYLVPKSPLVRTSGKPFEEQLEIAKTVDGYQAANFGCIFTLFFLNFLSHEGRLFDNQAVRCNDFVICENGAKYVFQVGPFIPTSKGVPSSVLNLSLEGFAVEPNAALALISNG